MCCRPWMEASSHHVRGAVSSPADDDDEEDDEEEGESQAGAYTRPIFS